MSYKPLVKKRFINSINYFRGIAITFIVLGHSYDLSHWNPKNFGVIQNTVYSLTQNGSIFFLFISGFLFHHIFFNSFKFSKFLSKKIQYVLLPYLIISFLPNIYRIWDGPEEGYNLPGIVEGNPLLTGIWYLLTGNMIFGYWYIPVAMMLFILSPVVIWLVKKEYLLIAFLSLLPISIFLHRPFNNINPFHSLLYFFPVYLFGVWCSVNKNVLYKFLDNKRSILLLMSIFLALIQSIFFDTHGNFHNQSFLLTNIPDINLIQKILLCLFFMSFLNLYENKNIWLWEKTAQTSFPIYFIHPFLVMIGHKLIMGWEYQGNFITLLFTTVVLLLTSMAIAYTVKAVFKKNSRYIIGW